MLRLSKDYIVYLIESIKDKEYIKNLLEDEEKIKKLRINETDKIRIMNSIENEEYENKIDSNLDEELNDENLLQKFNELFEDSDDNTNK